MHKLHGESLPYSARGFAAVNEFGEPLCIAAIRREADRFVIFSDATPEARATALKSKQYQKYALLLARRTLGLVPRHYGRVYAAVDLTIPRAREFLLHLGFEQLGDSEVFVWRV